MKDGSDGHRRRRLLFGLAVLALVINAAGTFVLTKPWRSAPAALPTVTAAHLIHLLLSPQELDTIMGTNGARVIAASVGNLDADAPTVDPKPAQPDCLAPFTVGAAAVYTDSGFTGVNMQTLSAHDPDSGVTQAAVSFPSANEAQAFLDSSAAKWAACVNQVVDINSGNGTETWTFGPLRRSLSRIVQNSTEGGAPDSACQRVLSAASNIVFDIKVCRADPTEAAGRIADAMTRNIARTPSTTAPLPGAPAVMPAERIMVDLPDINSIMGTTDIVETDRQDSVNTDWTASEADCLGSMQPAAWPVYAGSGFTDIGYQIASADDGSDDLSAYVVQSAATFATDGDAQAFFAASANRWQACADRAIQTGFQSDPDTGQRLGPLTRTDVSLEQVSTPTDRRQWACQHALRLVAATIVEAKVCGPAIGDPAARLTEIMVANAKG